MKLKPDRCANCGECVLICPVDAISLQAGIVSIDRSQCVECGVCSRSNVCPYSVFEPEELPWPRALRAMFSDPATEHRLTRLAGRGIEEIKTNDVRRLYIDDMIGVSAEIGRPGVGASFFDVQCITRTLAESGAHFIADNPLMELIVDPAKGLLDPGILNERVLSVIVECVVPEAKLEHTLRSLIEASSELSAPVLLSVAGTCRADGSMSYQQVLDAMAIECLPTGKMNLGFNT
jgi:NAD-dependent dihydropyrimidine dehydrogenase PreA subunit